MKKLLVLCSALMLASCAYVPYAREAKKKPREAGIISLKPDYRPEDQEKAASLMAANCGSGATPKVLEEGEQVVGERSSSTANKTNEQIGSGGIGLGGGFSLGGRSKPSERVNAVSETTQLKEWQISYICEPIKHK